VLSGRADVNAFAGHIGDHPWRAIAHTLETVIEDAATRQPLAWFPLSLDPLATHPSRRAWAGGVADYLCLFTLEGDPQRSPKGREGRHA
jgi:hypothetical protein